MARPLRITYEGAWYHVMNRGLAKNPIFHNDYHRQLFLNLLVEIHNRYQVEIHAYCLMDNHYHLLIRTLSGNISRAMRHLDGLYTQRFNFSVNRDGPLFRGRFKSILVEADVYLLRLTRYIHFNPVVAKLVKKPEHYKWSSYRAYLTGNNSYWLNTEFTLSYFGKILQKQKYKTFIEEGIDSEIGNVFKKLKNVPILGTEAFIKTITEKYLQEQHKIAEIPEHKSVLESKSVSMDVILSAVTSHFGLKSGDIYIGRIRNGTRPRAIVMFLAFTVGQASLAQIAAKLGGITLSGVSLACRRLQKQIQLDEGLRMKIEDIKKAIIDMSNVET